MKWNINVVVCAYVSFDYNYPRVFSGKYKSTFISVQTQTTRPKFASQMEPKHDDVPRFLKDVRANTLRSESP